MAHLGRTAQSTQLAKTTRTHMHLTGVHYLFFEYVSFKEQGVGASNSLGFPFHILSFDS